MQKLPFETLCELGLTVGADVPFCLCGGSARVQGNRRDPETCAVAAKVLVGGLQASTGVDTVGWHTGQWMNREGGPSAHAQHVLEGSAARRLKKIGATLGNVFEEVVQLPGVKSD